MELSKKLSPLFSRSSAVFAALGASALMFAGTANAIILDLNGGTSNPDNVTFVWAYTNVDGANLNASATLTLTGLSSNTATFSVVVNNLTTTSQPGTNRLVSFGIDKITPAITNAQVTTQVNTNPENWGALVDTNFPGFQSVQLCVFAGNNCSGGSNNGLIENTQDAFTLALTGVFNGTIQFDSPFPSKWQAVGNTGKSWELDGCIQGDTNCRPRPPTEIPEPGTLLMIGAALAGLGAARRKASRA